MYQTIIIYLVVILVYSARPERPPELCNPLSSLLLACGLLALYALLIRRRSRAGARRAGFGAEAGELFDRLQFQFQLASLVTFSLLVFGADLGSLLGRLPLVGSSEALSTLLALGLFGLLQALAWRELHRDFSSRIELQQPCAAYIRSRLRFGLGLIAPWIFILLLSDLASLWLPAGMVAKLEQPAAQIVIFIAFLLFMTAIAPPLLVHLWRCRRLPDSPLREAIVALCRRQRVGCREIMLWQPFEGRMATAAVIGAFPWSRYLVVTPDLLRLLDGREVLAVMSHELGHVRYRHLLYFLLFFLTFFVFNFLYYDLGTAWLLTTGPALKLLESSGGTPEIFLSLLEIVPLLLGYLLFFRYIFGWFLRNFERQADLASLELPGLAPGLVSAFTKLGWLLGPAGEKPNWHHYNIPERIAFLRAAIADPGIARRHHRRIKKGLLIYLLLCILLCLPGLHWRRNGLARKLHYRYLCQRLEHLLEERPGNGRLHLALGSLYLECGQELPAFQHLEQALVHRPRDPEALNNLAWLLLTAKEEALRDYPRALELARRAARYKAAPHILDTLAEACWRARRAAEAIAIEQQALEKLPPGSNRDHYRKQLEKFRREPDTCETCQ